MKIKKIWFHLKWLFKRRYEIVLGLDRAMKGEEYIVCMKHDKKYGKWRVIG